MLRALSLTLNVSPRSAALLVQLLLMQTESEDGLGWLGLHVEARPSPQLVTSVRGGRASPPVDVPVADSQFRELDGQETAGNWVTAPKTVC